MHEDVLPAIGVASDKICRQTCKSYYATVRRDGERTLETADVIRCRAVRCNIHALVSACHSISYANVLDPERDQAAVPGDSGTSAAYRCALGQSGVPVMDVDAGDDARCEIRRFALEHDETAICRESTRPRA